MMREDLQAQITDVYPSPGTILVVHPKEGVQFNPTYADWLAKTLESLLPVGVKGMVLAENVTQFDIVAPSESSEDYLLGWNDAIRTLAKLN